jgi:hypothetical protein
MIDNPEKTPRLLAALKAAAPFEVELPPSLVDHLQAENVVNADRNPTQHQDLARWLSPSAFLPQFPPVGR